MDWRKNSSYFSIALLLVVLLMSVDGMAQTSEGAFDQQSWEEAKDDLDYGEMKDREVEEQEEPEESDASNWDWSFPSLGQGGRILLLSLIGVLLIVLIAKLMGQGSLSGRGRLKKERTFSLDEIEENLHESDLEKYLRLSLEGADFQAALRIYYLMVIKRLSELEMIIWTKDKTNFDYVRELRRKSFYKDFRSLTLTFELIWYGDVSINENDYKSVSPEFQRVIDELNKTLPDEPTVE